MPSGLFISAIPTYVIWCGSAALHWAVNCCPSNMLEKRLCQFPLSKLDNSFVFVLHTSNNKTCVCKHYFRDIYVRFALHKRHELSHDLDFLFGRDRSSFHAFA